MALAGDLRVVGLQGRNDKSLIINTSTKTTETMKTETQLITHKQYMDGESTHREYYAQFISPWLKSSLAKHFGVGRIKKHIATGNDISHKDRIPLKKWDSIANWVSVRMEPYGDFLTLAGQVCILKEAAEQIAEEN